MMSAIDTKPNNFIGYWGYGSERKLDRLLNKFVGINLQKSPKTKVSHLYERLEENSNLVWNVVYFSDLAVSPTKLSTETLTIAASSASGLPDLDSWVKILEDGSLVLGREPFGRVPLYWTQQQVIWFASKLQLLLPIVNPQVNISAFYGYIC